MEMTLSYEVGKLLGRLTRLHRILLDQSMVQHGLNRSQAMLLFALAHEDGRAHSVLAERLEISPAGATKMIKQMEQAGYVERRPDPADERVSRVYLLPKGRAVLAEIHNTFGALDSTMFGGLSEADLVRLREMLTRMHANLQDCRPECGAGVHANPEIGPILEMKVQR